MVERADNDTERSLTQLFDDFVTVVHMVVVPHVVLLLIRVKPVVRCFVKAAPRCAARQLRFFTLPLLTLLHVKVVNSLIL